MLSRNAPFFHLCECLQGKLPARKIDWMSVIELANNSLTTPALKDFAYQFSKAVPADVQAYLTEIHGRNRVRNERLAKQLVEAIAALNSVNITPTLIKGAAMLVSTDALKTGNRIMADLDILVAPEQIKSALNCLSQLGYSVSTGDPVDPRIHFVTVQRPDDVGQIDLHRRLPGPDFFYSTLGPIHAHCKIFMYKNVSTNLLSPTYHALILICHDQFQDGDYRAAKIDLRHFLDLRQLINSPEGVDWELLDSLPKDNFVRNGIETYLVTLHELLGVEVPLRFRKHFVPRFQYWRRSQNINMPKLRFILSLTALMLDCPGYLKHRKQTFLGRINDLPRQPDQIGRSVRKAPTWGGLKWMLHHQYFDKEQIAGKIG